MFKHKLIWHKMLQKDSLPGCFFEKKKKAVKLLAQEESQIVWSRKSKDLKIIISKTRQLLAIQADNEIILGKEEQQAQNLALAHLFKTGMSCVSTFYINMTTQWVINQTVVVLQSFQV